MVLLGPNHLGFANFTEGIPVCSIPSLPRAAGPVALLSQSGASSSAMLDFATMVNVGLSYLVTLGNEAMITAGHVLDFLVDDPGTKAIAIFMETVREGVLISPMRRGGTELLVGVVRDPQWGPVLAVAVGGIFVEVLQDSALAPLPVTPAQGGRLLHGLRGGAVLNGVRGAAPADQDALAAVIARIGDLALALGDDLESLEVNP